MGNALHREPLEEPMSFSVDMVDIFLRCNNYDVVMFLKYSCFGKKLKNVGASSLNLL